MSEIEVEALPTDLPEKFTVDIGQLKAVDDAVTVGELKAPQGVEILAGKNEVLAQISPLAKEEEAAPPSEVAEGEAEGEEGEEAKPEAEKPAKCEVEAKKDEPQKEASPKPEAEKPVEEKAKKK